MMKNVTVKTVKMKEKEGYLLVLTGKKTKKRKKPFVTKQLMFFTKQQ
jgi:IMP cyclohydrolase